MKLLLISVFAAALLSLGTAQAVTSYDALEGKWSGTITTNLKDATGGGNPTAGTTGTKVEISFSKAMKGLHGMSKIGDAEEQWMIEGDKYSWDDKMMTVTTSKMTFKDLPEWVVKQAKLNKKDTFWAFKYADCKINKTKKACEKGKDLPDGIETSGIWLFKVDGKNLLSSVYYKYSNGGKRILEQRLERTK